MSVDWTRQISEDRDRHHIPDAGKMAENTVFPLHRSPTLTESEREAIEQAIDAANDMVQAEPWTAATLRKLLERLK